MAKLLLLLLQLLLTFVVTVFGIPKNSFHFPTGCSLPKCIYTANWTKGPDGLTVVVNAKQPIPGRTWTGIGFSKEKNTKRMDVVYCGSSKLIGGHGIWENGEKVVTLPPPIMTKSQMDGRLVIEFTHPFHRELDKTDFSFTDKDCYYLCFFVDNGKMPDDKDFILFNASKKIFSDKPMCVKDVKTEGPSSPPGWGMGRDDYMRQRGSLVGAERAQRTGGSIALSDDERRVNDSLMGWKLKEMDAGQAPNGTFPPAVHFFTAKSLIDQSLVFKFIKKMPKGAALHGHDFALGDMNWVIKEATYDSNCYMCFDKSNLLLFHFFKVPPSDKDCQWTPVTKLRALSPDPVKFDEELYHNITLVVDDPDMTYPDGDSAWKRFQSLFSSVNGLLLYLPILKKFIYEVLREHYEDNVQYLEMRGLLVQAYDLEGRVYDREFIVGLYQNVSNLFVKDHPDFVGLRFIPTSSRSTVNESSILNDILDVIELRKKFPGFVVGYDIVGQEDRGGSLLSYIDALLYPSQQGISLPYFFHAGETNFEDSSVDLNILDAILLNTSRIGHGFAITKHPGALKLILEKDIAIEICPISNQVLRLVRDLRNHPAADLMAHGYPITIGADDPGLWGATGLSYDFYEAFMGFGGMWADLATLKQLAINSIKYSGLSYKDKTFAFDLWQKKWNTFIHEVAMDI